MNENKKMHPLLVVLIIIVALNIFGFVMKLLFQTAILALFIFVVYVIWQTLTEKKNGTDPDRRDRKSVV